MRGIVLLALIAACGFGSAPSASPDGGPDAYRCHHVRLDAGAWGGACIGSGECRGATDFGWCVEGVCRPQCVQPLGCLACEGTAEHFSAAGQCYCAP